MEHEPIRYHVIYRSGEQTRVLGRIAGVPATSFTLDPFLSRLLLAGIRHGDILLVEETTRRIVVQHAVCFPRRRPPLRVSLSHEPGFV